MCNNNKKQAKNGMEMLSKRLQCFYCECVCLYWQHIVYTYNSTVTSDVIYLKNTADNKIEKYNVNIQGY